MICKICGVNETDNSKGICNDCEYYKKHRDRWKPDNVTILFIAESPPRPRKNGERPYFYNEESQDDDGLWNQFNMALDFTSNGKEEFLKEFQKRGYMFGDIFPTYWNFEEFQKKQYNANRKHIISHFTNMIIENQPEKIVFVCKRAVSLLSLPFPRYSKENKDNFIDGIRNIIDG